MKRIFFFIKGMVGIAAFALFISCNNNQGTTTQPTSEVNSSEDAARFPIAYINTDSLLGKYQFVIDRNEANLKKLEDKRLGLNRQLEKWRKEVLEYQQKVQMNAYYSRERQEEEGTRLARKEQELEQSAANAEQEMAMEQMRLQQQLMDTINIALKEFNKGKYEMIFSNAGASTFFYIDESYDITQEVIDFLNSRYIPEE